MRAKQPVFYRYEYHELSRLKRRAKARKGSTEAVLALLGVAGVQVALLIIYLLAQLEAWASAALVARVPEDALSFIFNPDAPATALWLLV